MKAADISDWNDFNAASESGTFFHRAEWLDVFEQSLGHDGYYFIAETEGKITGILPLMHMRSRLFGNLLLSLPFLAYGGVVAADAESSAALVSKAIELAKSLDVDHAEFRNREPMPELPSKPGYVTFRKSLPETVDECLLSIPRKQRAMVRKGIKNELEARIEEGLEHFYPVFSTSYRNLGTPVLSRKYFDAIKVAFGEDCRVLTVYKEETAIASVMSFYFRDEVIPYYGGSLPIARKYMANDFMYWDLMRRSCEDGIRIFDYGRSREGTGSYRFKKHWGFEPEPLNYQYQLIRQDAMPDLSPGNPKYQLAIAVWKKLPAGLTRWLGPMLAKDLPG